ncbi:hypothetical protein KIN20_003423 [Parelaphostrongylus tenuis]|uniref:Uncharacterized protein n=1 Tax=Parelaphostrongylus tenuis TaxID=148309 RepID=A0AAD5QDQ2_PARTN|nr:hypothetical protein KIN20_003423 [Parelaphostrongylus tenuis]
MLVTLPKFLWTERKPYSMNFHAQAFDKADDATTRFFMARHMLAVLRENQTCDENKGAPLIKLHLMANLERKAGNFYIRQSDKKILLLEKGSLRYEMSKASIMTFVHTNNGFSTWTYSRLTRRSSSIKTAPRKESGGAILQFELFKKAVTLLAASQNIGKGKILL